MKFVHLLEQMVSYLGEQLFGRSFFSPVPCFIYCWFLGGLETMLASNAYEEEMSQCQDKTEALYWKRIRIQFNLVHMQVILPRG